MTDFHYFIIGFTTAFLFLGFIIFKLIKNFRKEKIFFGKLMQYEDAKDEYSGLQITNIERHKRHGIYLITITHLQRSQENGNLWETKKEVVISQRPLSENDRYYFQYLQQINKQKIA